MIGVGKRGRGSACAPQTAQGRACGIERFCWCSGLENTPRSRRRMREVERERLQLLLRAPTAKQSPGREHRLLGARDIDPAGPRCWST